MRHLVFLFCLILVTGGGVSAEPMELSQLVDLAMRHHPKTKEAWAHACAAGYQWQMERSRCYPTADLTGEACVAKREYHGQDSTNDQELRYNLAISYLLLDFGGRKATIDASRYGFYGVRWSRDRVMQEVVLGVLQTYYQYVDAKATLEAKQEDLRDAKTNAQSAEALFNAGLTSRVDVLQSQSEFLNQQLQLEEKRGIYQVSLGQLANAVGLPADTELQIVDLPSDLPLEQISKNMEELLERAAANRPDLAAANAFYAQKKADFSAACSDGKPTLSANVEVYRNNYLHTPSHNSHHYSGCLTLNIPLFHGFFYKNQRRKVEAEVEEARASLENLESNATLEVVRSYYAFQTAVETHRYTEDFMKTSNQSYQAALAGYREGINTLLDVLAAQCVLSKARSETIQARTLWLVSLANIAFATGTLGDNP